MEIEIGTKAQLKSVTSKVYRVNSVSDAFLECVFSDGERKALSIKTMLNQFQIWKSWLI